MPKSERYKIVPWTIIILKKHVLRGLSYKTSCTYSHIHALIILVQIRATRLAKSRHRGKSYFILVNNHHIQNGFLGEKISLPFDFLFLNEIGSVVSIY